MFLVNRFFWAILGMFSIAFHISLIFSGLVPNLVSRPLHMVFSLPWILVFTSKTISERALGIIHCFVSTWLCLWIVFNEEKLGEQYGSLEDGFQVVASVILLISYITSNGSNILDTISKHPPPSKGKSKIIIKNAFQKSSKPPTFEIKVQNGKLLHFTYKRYIENGLRNKFGLNGVPIKLYIK